MTGTLEITSWEPRPGVLRWHWSLTVSRQRGRTDWIQPDGDFDTWDSAQEAGECAARAYGVELEESGHVEAA